MIPEQYLELEHIYNATLAKGMRSLAVTSANSGEGVSSVLASLANRNLYADRATLIVDFNLFRPNIRQRFSLPADTVSSSNTAITPYDNKQLSNINIKQQLPPPHLITHSKSQAPLAVITPNPCKTTLLQLREPGTIEEMIECWKKDYDSILFDTSAINSANWSNLPAPRAAAASDGALLVILSGHTTETMLATATKKLTNAGAVIVGCVMNDRDNPQLNYELIREANRIEGRFPRLSAWLKKKVRNTPILNLEI